MGSDWLSRVSIPDMYPRTEDPFRPRQGAAGPAVTTVPEETGGDDLVTIALTQPGQRPVVSQRAVNFGISVGTTSIGLNANRLEIDGFMIIVPSTAANSVWLGFGSSVTIGTGIEIRPGIPQFFGASNDRQQWELQRSLEFIAAALAMQTGLPLLPSYRAPRVVLNAADWFLIASATTACSVAMFFIPEQQ